MRKGRFHQLPMVLFVGLALTSTRANADSYANARFGYSVSYPEALLVPEREADNGDGRQFHARHGAGKMTVWGGFQDGDIEQSPESIARQYETDCREGKVAYRIAKPGLVALSCITPIGTIIYQKTLIRADHVLASVRLEYPTADRTTWDRVVNQVSKSLSMGKPGDGLQLAK